VANDEEFEALRGRVTELENLLGLGVQRAAVTRGELDTFLKVREALTCWPCPEPQLAALLGLPPRVNPDDEGGAGRIGGLGK
jgi:hypothetical protein